MPEKQKEKKPADKGRTSENQLPQNIASIGDCAHTEKCIYIAQPVYKRIHVFSQNKTKVESGGVLLGRDIEAFGKTHVLISAFIPAKYSTATSQSITFTHESWDYIHQQAEKFPGLKIIGWIHTHPDYGIFLSENDKFIQQNVFFEEYQVAYVIDPVREDEGFYFWQNGSIEKSTGFYLYDKMGVKIISPGQKEGTDAAVVSASKAAKAPINRSALLLVVTAVLAAACLALGVFAFFMNRRVVTLQNRIHVLENQVNVLDVDKAFSN